MFYITRCDGSLCTQKQPVRIRVTLFYNEYSPKLSAGCSHLESSHEGSIKTQTALECRQEDKRVVLLASAHFRGEKGLTFRAFLTREARRLWGGGQNIWHWSIIRLERNLKVGYHLQPCGSTHAACVRLGSQSARQCIS